MTRRDDIRVGKALQAAEFPADRPKPLTYAQGRGVDEETLEALRALPARTYADATEVIDAVPQEPEGDRRSGVER